MQDVRRGLGEAFVKGVFDEEVSIASWKQGPFQTFLINLRREVWNPVEWFEVSDVIMRTEATIVS